jgi:hypothetical protein
VLQKYATNGAISAMLGTDRIPIQCTPDENLFTVLRAGEMGCRIMPIFGGKKEIRVKTLAKILDTQIHRRCSDDT